MKKGNATAWREYPRPLKINSGCKVSWYSYATLEEAKECSEAAISNARIKSYQGYDFGYQCPGDISKSDNGWEVCIP